MDEIRCPMCGNLNPAELEECQYCQARLKPLIISQQPEEEPDEGEGASSISSEEEGLPDWLQDLRMGEGGMADQESAEVEGETPYEEESDADWLARLQEPSPTDDEGSESKEPEIEPSDEDELPEWLSEISPVAESSYQEESELELPEHELPSRADEPLPDWMAEGEPVEPQESPEWLTGAGVEAEATEGEEEHDEALPEADDDAEPVEPAVEEEQPEWLEELIEEGQAERVIPLAERAEGEPVELQESPEWLTETGVDTEAFEGEEEHDEALPGAEDEAEQGEPVEPAAEEGQPEWLEELIEEDQAERVPPFEEKVEIEADESEIDEDELPDWLVDLAVDESAEEEDEEQPDWLAASETESETEVEEELPEWFAPPEVEGVDAEALPEETPEWVGDIEAEEIEEPVVTPAEEVLGEFEGEEVPEWLTELEQESVSAFVIDEGDEEEITDEVPPVAVDEGSEEILEPLPEWAEDVSIDEEAEEADEPELEEAELPNWLEAMRPVEAVAPDVPVEEPGEELVETMGPLAGLSGILAAETDFARVRKPPTYSVKLRVTEDQQARVTLLREMLSAEDKQKALPAQPVITPQYIFRLVIALALILPILWAVVSGGTLTPLPEPADAPPGVLDVRAQVESQLSSNSPVLIGFDYEAGFAAELEVPARAVISHLMDKGAYLTLVSTSPSGPLLAERLIDELNQTSIRQGSSFTNYSNLGYVPGGTTGLLSLAQAPKQTVPYTLDNIVVWESAPLNLVNTVADFSMVMVITENPETARAWVEQLQSFLQINETPMIMVVSAQAEPLVRPYYDGSPKQVNGIIVGLPGGAAYESLTGQVGLARSSWDAFSLSMLVAELILVVGAVVGLGTILFNSTKEEED